MSKKKLARILASEGLLRTAKGRSREPSHSDIFGKRLHLIDMEMEYTYSWDPGDINWQPWLWKALTYSVTQWSGPWEKARKSYSRKAARLMDGLQRGVLSAKTYSDAKRLIDRAITEALRLAASGDESAERVADGLEKSLGSWSVFRKKWDGRVKENVRRLKTWPTDEIKGQRLAQERITGAR